MAQLVKVLAAKSDDLSLVPRTHMVKERADSCTLPSDLYMQVACVCMCTHRIKIIKKNGVCFQSLYMELRSTP